MEMGRLCGVLYHRTGLYCIIDCISGRQFIHMNRISTIIDGMDQGVIFYVSLLVAFLLLRIPVLNSYLRTTNTLLHESGHALAAILMSGEAIEIKLNSNTSGSALTRTPSKAKAFWVSFSGYPIAALGSLLLMALSYHENYRTGFLILVSISLINLIVFVRNTYGIFWLITFCMVLFSINAFLAPPIALLLFRFICLITFIEGVTSTFVIVLLGLTKRKKAGDITLMEKLSGIPASLLALVLALVVGSISYITISRYFPPISQLFT